MKKQEEIGHKKIRCAIYTRKSCEEGLEQQFNSLDAQRELSENYIASQRIEGWEVLPQQYDDGGYSGGTLQRPALKLLFSDINAGKIDCVVVYKIDRLSRSLLDFTHIIDLFEKKNVTFVSVTQSFTTANSMGRLMLNVLLSFAQYERELTGERIRDKFAISKKKGMWMGGYPVLGYDIKERNLLVNHGEATLVSMIFQRFLVLRSPQKLADELNTNGYRTKCFTSGTGRSFGGEDFTRPYVRRILTNPLYKGYIHHQGELYKGQHEFIVSELLWEEVQSVFKTNSHMRGAETKTSHPSLLKHIFKCHPCGVPMMPHYTQKKSKSYHYYVCSNHHRGKKCMSSVKSIAAGIADQIITDQVRTLLRSPHITAKTLHYLEKEEIAEQEALALMHNVDRIWDTLFPLEQQYITKCLINTVWLKETGIEIKIEKENIGELLDYVGPVPENKEEKGQEGVWN